MRVATRSRDRLNHESRTGAEDRPETVEQAIRQAHALLAGANVPLSKSKVSTLARAYVNAGSPSDFRVFLARNIGSEPLARQLLRGFDPTGNAAARNVDRERGVAHV